MREEKDLEKTTAAITEEDLAGATGGKEIRSVPTDTTSLKKQELDKQELDQQTNRILKEIRKN